MLNGLYGFIFGNVAAADSAQKVISQENVAVLTNQLALVANSSTKNAVKIDDDWILVEDHTSGRSSPVFVANLELEELDSVSVASTVNTANSAPPSPAQIRHSEAVQHAKVLAAQRSRLEQKLFGDPGLLRPTNRCGDIRTKNVTSQLTASKLKRLVEGKFDLINDDLNSYDAEGVNDRWVMDEFLEASLSDRSTAAGHVASESKIKQRSKRGGKLLAGRNNDRKVNNLN